MDTKEGTIRELFKSNDINGQGTIKRSRLNDVLVRLGMPSEKCRKLLHQLRLTDQGDNCVDYDEFISKVFDYSAQPSIGNLRRKSLSQLFVNEYMRNVHDFYSFDSQLGEGGYGQVWLARERILPETSDEHSGRCVAVKRLPLTALSSGKASSTQAVQHFRSEIELLKSLDHPAICRLLQVYQDSQAIFLVMEHCGGGELFDRIIEQEYLHEAQAIKILRQVLEALVYCHACRVVHRDVKPENILFVTRDKDDVKLIDFGIACFASAKIRGCVGSLAYIAPEAIQGRKCTQKIDIWALGCVVYAMLSGSAPFGGAQIRSQIVQGSYCYSGAVWDDVHDAAKDFIRQLMEVDPDKRVDAEAALKHNWLCTESNKKTHPERIRKHLSRLQHFEKESEFRRVVTVAFARQVGGEQLHKIQKCFREIDTNCDGVIDLSEFQRAWHLGEIDVADDRLIEESFHSADLNNSGTITYTEFVAASLKIQITQQESVCWSAFRAFDTKGTGELTYDDVRAALQELRNVSSEGQALLESGVVDRIWKTLTEQPLDLENVSRDGTVDFKAFVRAFHGSNAEHVNLPSTTPAVAGSVRQVMDRSRSSDHDAEHHIAADNLLPLVSCLTAEHAEAPRLEIARKCELPIPHRSAALSSTQLPIMARQR